MDECKRFLDGYWYPLYVNGNKSRGWLYVNYNSSTDLYVRDNQDINDACALWRFERENDRSEFYYLVAKCMDKSSQRVVKGFSYPCVLCTNLALTYHQTLFPPTIDVLFKQENGVWYGYNVLLDQTRHKNNVVITNSQVLLYDKSTDETANFDTSGDPLLGKIIYNNPEATCRNLLSLRCSDAISIDNICTNYLISRGLMDDYCSRNVLYNDTCKGNYCGDKCISQLNALCSNPNNFNNPTCGCFLPNYVYTNFQKTLLDRLDIPISGDVRCYFPNCVSSGLLSRKVGDSCPSNNITVVECFTNVNIDNQGNVTGNINIDQKNNCIAKSRVDIADVSERGHITAVVLLTLVVVIALYMYT